MVKFKDPRLPIKISGGEVVGHIEPDTSICSCCGRVLVWDEIKVQLHATCGSCDYHICAHPDPNSQSDIEENKVILAGRLAQHVKGHRGEGSLKSSDLGRL